MFTSRAAKIERLVAAATACIHALALALHPAFCILAAPLGLASWRSLARAVARLVKLPLSLRTVVCEDRVHIGRDHVLYVYRVEPLVSCERIEAEKVSSLLQDFLKRLLSAGVAVGFARTANDTKYMLVLATRDKAGTIDTIERIASELFILRKLTRDELKYLIRTRSLAIPELLLLALPLLTFLIYFPYSLALIPVILYVLLRAQHELCVAEYFLTSTQTLYTAYRNELLFLRSEPSLLKTTLLLLSRSKAEYVFLVYSCPELEQIVEQELHKAQESLVVRERGRAYVRLLELRNIAERLSSGEQSLKIAVLTSSPRELGSVFRLRTGLPLDLFSEDSYVYALTGDVASLVPLYGGKLEQYVLQRVYVKLGRDKHEREVVVDLYSLPSQHILIVGPSGMGKTWTARMIVKQLVDQGVNIVVIDPHGEYASYFTSLRHVKLPDYLPNLFEVCEADVSERVYKLAKLFAYALGLELSPELCDLIWQVYSRSLHVDPLRALQMMSEEAADPMLKLHIDRLRRLYERAQILPVSKLAHMCILDLRGLLTSPDLAQFFMALLLDLIYTYLLTRREKKLSIVVVDEAYFILDSPLIELIVRGFRKFGVGVMLITQTLTRVSRDVLQNIGMSLILGGPDMYIATVAEHFDLTRDDVEWLSAAVPPAVQRRVRALLVTGPIKQHILIELS